MKTVVGIKKGMTRVFSDDRSVPVTIIDLSTSKVAYKGADGYELGVGSPLNKPNSALSGKYSELGSVPQFRVWVTGDIDAKVGDKIAVDDLVGKRVDITSVSKGKGFAGVVKRWGFAGGPKTHGQSDRHRAPGSIGAGTDPGRVLKGKKMGGRKGGERVTVLNKKVVEIKGDYLLISGAVPGANDSMVVINIQEK